MIDAALADGRPASFDLLGAEFTKSPPTPKLRSPEMRFTSHLSFFKEITPEQMATYTPDQIATILQQREHVRDVLTRQQTTTTGTGRHSCYVPSSGSRAQGPPPGLGFPDIRNRPWVTPEEDECQFKCCASCRPHSVDRSYLSLDAVVSGVYPSTAATGFGFHLQGSRPVIHVSQLRNIGYRPVPWPPAFERSHCSNCSSSSMYAQGTNSNVSSVMLSNGQDQGTPVAGPHPAGVGPETTSNIAAPVPIHTRGDMLARACATPLPADDPSELAGGEGRSSVGTQADDCTREGPLHVHGGLAVMEESVDLGIPDVVSQV